MVTAIIFGIDAFFVLLGLRDYFIAVTMGLVGGFTAYVYAFFLSVKKLKI